MFASAWIDGVPCWLVFGLGMRPLCSVCWLPMVRLGNRVRAAIDVSIVRPVLDPRFLFRCAPLRCGLGPLILSRRTGA